MVVALKITDTPTGRKGGVSNLPKNDEIEAAIKRHPASRSYGITIQDLPELTEEQAEREINREAALESQREVERARIAIAREREQADREKRKAEERKNFLRSVGDYK